MAGELSERRDDLDGAEAPDATTVDAVLADAASIRGSTELSSVGRVGDATTVGRAVDLHGPSNEAERHLRL